MQNVTPEDILGVVVVYNTSINKCSTLISLNKSALLYNKVLDIIIYDNSANSQQTSSLVSYTNLNFFYYHDITNPGVSKAYNYAAKKAVEIKKKFLLLLDQDTIFPDDSLQKYVEAVNKNEDQFLFCPILTTAKGIFSPLKYYFRRGMIWKNIKPGVYSLKNRSALNSGMLVSLTAYSLTGGYNNEIELYFSDFDFINRFKKQFKNIVVIDLYCSHSLSDIEKVDLISAIRRFKYYVSGSFNSILSFKDYIYIFATVFLRSLKLAWQYKCFTFINIFFKKYLLGKIN